MTFTVNEFYAAAKPLFDLLDTGPGSMLDGTFWHGWEDGRLVVRFKKVAPAPEDDPNPEWPIVSYHTTDPLGAIWVYDVEFTAEREPIADELAGAVPPKVLSYANWERA